MTYRVILTINGKYLKTLHKSRTRDTAFIHYHSIKDANSVMFERKYVNNGKIIEASYQICVIKETEDTDTFRVLRDAYGKLYVEKPIGDWTILDSEKYFIEENFWVFGETDRVTVKEIIKKLMVGAYAKKMVKQVIVIHNKLLIYHEEQFDMVICKNIYDAQRLHHSLAKIVKKQKIKSVLFMGTASKANIGRYYDIIQDNTKWPREKIHRTSTRP